MAQIKAFNGYIFSEEIVGNLGNVMAPSYTVESNTELDSLYDNSEYNAIRLVHGKTFESDNESENKFTRANEFLEKWISDGVIKKDEKPAIYLYEQAVLFHDTVYTNRGFVTLLSLDDYGTKVVSCENATPINKKHRYELLSKTKANFNMISCLYIESEKFLSKLITEISDTTPDISFTYTDGTKERLWRICDEKTISFIVDALSIHTLYIADGQNRIETALKYRNDCKEKNPNHTGTEPYNYIMALLSNAYDDGIVQLPYHRLVKFDKPFNESFMISALQDNFKVEKIIVDKDTSNLVDTIKHQIAIAKTETSLALYTGKDYFYRLTLTNSEAMKTYNPDKSDAYCSLDVAVLNSLILEDILGINMESYDDRIVITKSVNEGIKKVTSDEFGCLFAINPVKDSQIRSVATAGDKLPPKSICLFPKPITGVVIYKF